MFTAIVYVLTSGCAWRHLPTEFGVSSSTAHRRFMFWTGGLGNHLFRGLNSLKTAITRRLRHLQRQPELLAGSLAYTGLPLEPG